MTDRHWKIRSPKSFRAEREYIFEHLIRNVLDEGFEIEWSDKSFVEIESPDTKRCVRLSDSFFSNHLSAEYALKLPALPLKFWHPPKTLDQESKFTRPLPILFGSEDFYEDEQRISLGLDLFGSCFFCLSRVEEYRSLGAIGRFSANDSLAYQAGFLDRPLVDEFGYLLLQLLNWAAGTKRKWDSSFSIVATHDVDHLFKYQHQSPQKIMMQMRGAFEAERGLIKRAKNAFELGLTAAGVAKDPYDTYKELLSTATSVRHIFFLRSDASSAQGMPYYLDDKLKRRLSQWMERGADIGIHPSENAFQHYECLGEELSRLRGFVGQNIIRSRYHLLQFDVSRSARELAELGIERDHSLGYHDRVGFRCGTARSFPIFDLQTRRVLSIWEEPLQLMECSLMDRRYMNLGAGENARAVVQNLHCEVQRWGGSFQILWHNNRMVKRAERQLYYYSCNLNQASPSGKILFLVDDMQQGGIQKTVSGLSRVLSDENYELHLMSLERPGTKSLYPLDSRMRVYMEGDPRTHLGDRKSGVLSRIFSMIKMVLHLRRVFTRLGASGDEALIVMSFRPHSHFYARIASLGMNVSLVANERNYTDYELRHHGWATRLGHRLALIIVKHLTVQTRHAKRELPWFLRWKAQVIPNVLYNLPSVSRSREKYILAVGRLHSQKRFDVLIEAFARLSKKYPDWNLRIAGEGGLEAELRDLSAKLGIESRVEFLGFVGELSELYAQSGIFVLTSDYEGFPNVLLEAMSHGLPCISSDCRYGPAEILESGKRGLLFKPGSVDDLTEKLEMLLRDEELRNRLGAQAIVRSRDFSWEKVSGVWLKLLERVAMG